MTGRTVCAYRKPAGEIGKSCKLGYSSLACSYITKFYISKFLISQMAQGTGSALQRSQSLYSYLVPPLIFYNQTFVSPSESCAACEAKCYILTSRVFECIYFKFPYLHVKNNTCQYNRRIMSENPQMGFHSTFIFVVLKLSAMPPPSGRCAMVPASIECNLRGGGRSLAGGYYQRQTSL